MCANELVKWGMAKPRKPVPREIFLGEWLEFFDIGASEAATIARCTQGYISNISRGARDNINTLYLLALSEEMGITVNDLFRRPPSKNQRAQLQGYSPEAQTSILGRKQRKA